MLILPIEAVHFAGRTAVPQSRRWSIGGTLLIGLFAAYLDRTVNRRADPKTAVIAFFTIWAAATILVGFTSSVAVLLVILDGLALLAYGRTTTRHDLRPAGATIAAPNP